MQIIGFQNKTMKKKKTEKTQQQSFLYPRKAKNIKKCHMQIHPDFLRLLLAWVSPESSIERKIEHKPYKN